MLRVRFPRGWWSGLGLVCAVVNGGGAAGGAELVIDRDNIVITESVRLKPGTYTVPDADGNGVLQIGADNVVVDFAGATLAAAGSPGADLTKAEGVGVAVGNAKNVTIRNAKVHGYMFNIRAMNADGLTLEDCDVSFSRAQRIAEGGQPIEIWLVLRSLEAWRSYGAGIWIEASRGTHVRRCRGSGAQNGLLLVSSPQAEVVQNDFSFNSGFGVGLWASSDGVVAWNRIDFVNRPWGGGWGGDSAALVIVNGSNDNLLVGNSLTHSGDGLFLTDRLNGGIDERTKTSNFDGACDRNIVALNDGSWSTANAFEGTFSKGNVYYRNVASDSNFGYWLGYSNESLLLENEIERNRFDGIAIEHGSGTRIEANRFADNRGSAIALWAGGPDWLRKLHPSQSIDLRDNVIRNCGRAYRLEGSSDVAAAGNQIEGTPDASFAFAERPPSGALAAFRNSARHQDLQKLIEARPKGFKLLRDESGPRGVDWLAADEYAPRDYRGGLVAWRNRDAATLEVLPLVPGVSFKLPEWLSASRDEAKGVYLISAKSDGGPGEWKRYEIGVSANDSDRKQTLTGAFLTAQWDVRWYRWDQPAKLEYDDGAAWEKLFKSDPIFRQTTRELSPALWRDGFPEGVPHGHFAIVARTKVRLPAGRYRFSTLSDDGIRVLVGDREVISRWNHHGPTPDQAETELPDGVHEIVVHYCQETGAYALSLAWRKLDK